MVRNSGPIPSKRDSKLFSTSSTYVNTYVGLVLVPNPYEVQTPPCQKGRQDRRALTKCYPALQPHPIEDSPTGQLIYTKYICRPYVPNVEKSYLRSDIIYVFLTVPPVTNVVKSPRSQTTRYLYLVLKAQCPTLSQRSVPTSTSDRS